MLYNDYTWLCNVAWKAAEALVGAADPGVAGASAGAGAGVAGKMCCSTCEHPIEIDDEDVTWEARRADGTGGRPFHNACRNAVRHLEHTAGLMDKKSKFGERSNKLALDELKAKQPELYKEKVMSLIIRDKARRKPSDLGKTMQILQEVMMATEVAEVETVMWLHERRFKQHFKMQEGYNSDEAEEEWSITYQNKDVRRKLDKKNRICLAVDDVIQ